MRPGTPLLTSLLWGYNPLTLLASNCLRVVFGWNEILTSGGVRTHRTASNQIMHIGEWATFEHSNWSSAHLAWVEISWCTVLFKASEVW